MERTLSSLIGLTLVPELYEPGPDRMWDDPYISGQLLQIHLDQHTDAASRNLATIRRTVIWIESHLKRSSAILDMGCGPGLYAERFAAHGHQVTGVDFSSRAIGYARSQAATKGLDITYLHEDYLNMNLEERFDLVILIYCDLSVLIPIDRNHLLDQIYTLLNPGGCIIFDVLNEHAPGIMTPGKKEWEVVERGFWKPHPYLALSETVHYPGNRVILDQHVIYSETDGPAIYRFWNHYYGVTEMTSILKSLGFSDVEAYNGVLPDDPAGQNRMVTFYKATKPEGC